MIFDTKRHVAPQPKTLDARIDDLYRLPLAEFTAARNALAKTLTGDEAKRIRALLKPTLVPWALNQLFWKARPTYERLLKSGDALRKAQIATLEGRAGDARRASEGHRKALADALRETARLAEAEGSRPGADDLARMLEALSLSATHPERPGRLTEIVHPAGFEALAGVPVAEPREVPIAPPREPAPSARAKEPVPVTPATAEQDGTPGSGLRGALRPAAVVSAEVASRTLEHAPAPAAAARRERETAAAKRRDAEARVNAAEGVLERAKDAEAAARDAFERAREARHAAEAALAAARQGALE